MDIYNLATHLYLTTLINLLNLTKFSFIYFCGICFHFSKCYSKANMGCVCSVEIETKAILLR